MLNSLKIAGRYLQFLLTARTKYYIHSPFVYDFCESVLSDRRRFYAFADIIGLRSHLELDTREIAITDYGAGSSFNKSSTRKIQDLNQKVSTPDRDGKLLFRIVDRYKPQNVLELGTCLGVGTMYLARACAGKVWTIEGSENLADLAAANFDMMQQENIVQRVGSFESQLSPCLEEMQHVDLVFFDGNHREKATMQYFETCLQYAHEHSIFIFDDIYWSEGMMKAWAAIKADARVSLSLDLFHLGLCFFHKGKSKEDFKLYMF